MVSSHVRGRERERESAAPPPPPLASRLVFLLRFLSLSFFIDGATVPLPSLSLLLCIPCPKIWSNAHHIANTAASRAQPSPSLFLSLSLILFVGDTSICVPRKLPVFLFSAFSSDAFQTLPPSLSRVANGPPLCSSAAALTPTPLPPPPPNHNHTLIFTQSFSSPIPLPLSGLSLHLFVRFLRTLALSRAAVAPLGVFSRHFSSLLIIIITGTNIVFDHQKTPNT